MDLCYRSIQIQWNIKIIQALYDITLQAATLGAKFCHALYFGTFQHHTSRHDKSDVSGTKDHHTFTGHPPSDIYIILCRSGAVDACRSAAGDIQCSPGTFSASHSQDHGLRLDFQQPVLFVHGSDFFTSVRKRRNIGYHGVQQIGDLRFFCHIDITFRILRSGQLLFKSMQSETVVDTLVQNAAQFSVTL